MKKCCAAILMCLPLGAMAYPIDVDKHLDGVKLDYGACLTLLRGVSQATPTQTAEARELAHRGHKL